jgi:predicted nucleic acid-binding protein
MDLQAQLFDKIHIPVEVRGELMREAAPKSVRTWMASPPTWVQIHTGSREAPEDVALLRFRPGRTRRNRSSGIYYADLLLIDERAGAILAQQRGFAATGTLGLLDLACRGRLVHLREVFPHLQKTNFRYPPSLIEALLNDERGREQRAK